MDAPVCDPKAKKAVNLRLIRPAPVMATTLIGGLPARILREPIANLADQQAEIVGAVEMLVTGV